MDAVQALDAAFHSRRDPGFLELVPQRLLYPRQELLALFAASFNGIVYLLEGDGIDITKPQILKFTTNFPHAKAMGNRGVDL